MVGRILPRIFVFLLLAGMLLVAAQQASAATFSCTIRTSCNAGETLLLRLNSSEPGIAPNNSHAQLPNSTAPAYPYAVCCTTDAFRTLTNTCGSESTAVLKLANTTDSHVQAGSQSGYIFDVCLNVTSGNITCEYNNNACSGGFSPVVSIASSETADSNLTNAHVGDFSLYLRKVCCQVGGQGAPSVAYANISPNGTTTTRIDLECQNGPVSDPDGDSVTLHYNWYRNGTSQTLLNLPMDYDGASTTHDISTRAKDGTIAGNPLFAPTGGKVGGAFVFDGQLDNITAADAYHPVAYTIAGWVKLSTVSAQTIIVRTASSGPRTSWSHMLRVSSSNRFEHYTFDGGSKTVTGSTTPSSGVWYHIVATANNSGVARLYVNGQEEGTAVSIGTLWTGGDRYMIGPESETAGTYKNLNGTIDEIIIFNRSLTADEVRTLYSTDNRFFNSTELRKGEFWNCSISPVDSTGIIGTTTAYSNRTQVNGSAPFAPNLSHPVHNNVSVFERYVTFNWTAADERDGDQINYTLNLTLAPATCTVQTLQNNIQVRNYTFGELCTDLRYNWTIRACDVDGCSGLSTISNFTVASVAGLRFVINRTQFGTFDRGESKATDVNGIMPLIINNTGNVRINVTIVGNNSPFSTVALPSTYYQFKAGVNASSAFNQSGSQMSYTPIDAVYKNLIKQLNYSASAAGYAFPVNSTARIEMNITAPMDEPPGQKRGNITVKAVAG